MDRRVVIVALAGFLFVLILLVLAIRIFLGLISPGEDAPSPSPAIVSAATPSPVIQTQAPPIVSQTEVDENTKEFLMENEGMDFTVKEMKVEAFDRVKVTFAVNRGDHTWTIKEFNATSRILGAGEAETIEFVADRTGTFEYYCSVGDHRKLGMKGRLIVK